MLEERRNKSSSTTRIKTVKPMVFFMSADPRFGLSQKPRVLKPYGIIDNEQDWRSCLLRGGQSEAVTGQEAPSVP